MTKYLWRYSEVSVKPHTLKNLEENQEEIFQVIDMGKTFLNTNLKALERARIDKWDCINLQGMHTTKEKNGMKNQPSQWEKYEVFS